MSSSSSNNAISYKVVGTPFSTFTRTITLGLHYKGIPFEQIVTFPHSDVARDAHPYGYLPTLTIEGPNGQSTKLSESQAIVRYLDRVYPEPSLHFKPSSSPDSTNVLLEEKMWEVVSLVASFGTRSTGYKDLIVHPSPRPM
jgi:glutathione S-transferase